MPEDGLAVPLVQFRHREIWDPRRTKPATKGGPVARQAGKKSDDLGNAGGYFPAHTRRSRMSRGCLCGVARHRRRVLRRDLPRRYRTFANEPPSRRSSVSSQPSDKCSSQPSDTFDERPSQSPSRNEMAYATPAKTTADRYLERSKRRLKPRSFLEVERHLRRHWSPLKELPRHSVRCVDMAARLSIAASSFAASSANKCLA